jgi:hypothetical protein
MSSVDVVVPCYNYGRYLRECVASILGQEGVDVRVLVIDDCSSDDSAEVGAKLAAEDPRVEFRRHAVNRGHIRTYNEGLLEWARGDYSLLLSADDALAPGALRRAAGLLDARPDMVMAYGRAVRTTDPGGEPPPDPEGPATTILSGPDFFRFSCEEAGNPVPTPTAVVRTSVQQLVGGYRPELPHSGDMEMWLRFAARGAIGVIDCVQAYQRFHPTNMSVDYRGLRDLRERKAAFDSVFEACAAQLSDPAALRATAYRKLACQACRGASGAFKAGCTPAEATDYLRLATELWPGVTRHPRYMKVRAEMLAGAGVSRLMTSALNRLRRTRAGGDGAGDLLRRPYSTGRCSPEAMLRRNRAAAT